MFRSIKEGLQAASSNSVEHGYRMHGQCPNPPFRGYRVEKLKGWESFHGQEEAETVIRKSQTPAAKALVSVDDG